jgi:hypothetical protein
VGRARKFFDELPGVMEMIPPLPGEEALYGMIDSVLMAASKDPQLKAALTQAAVATETEVITPLFEFHNNGRPVGQGWTSPPNGARWGTDYLSRTATAKSNMYDNAPEETRYIYTDFDSGGQRLSGANRYTVTFPKGQLPPVNGFWSLTLYNNAHLFEANRLNYQVTLANKCSKFQSIFSRISHVDALSFFYPLALRPANNYNNRCDYAKQNRETHRKQAIVFKQDSRTGIRK